MSGREGAGLHKGGCVCTLQGGLFINPEPRQQLAFLQGLGGSVVPYGMLILC